MTFQHRGALLLSSAAFKDHVVPEEWCELVVGSEADISCMGLKIIQEISHTSKCTFKRLRPNTPTEIEYDESKITLTLIPAGKSEDDLETHLYYIES